MTNLSKCINDSDRRETRLKKAQTKTLDPEGGKQRNSPCVEVLGTKIGHKPQDGASGKFSVLIFLNHFPIRPGNQS
jgi:hypothetical protein